MSIFSRAKALSNVNINGLASLREEVNAAFRVCAAFDAAIPGLGLREAYVADITTFCLYMASSDGEITGEEVEVLNMILGTSFSKGDANALADLSFRRNLSEYARTVPESFQMLAHAMHRANVPGIDPVVLAYLYSRLGAFIASADGVLDDNELNAYKDYVLMLLDHLKNIQ